MLVKKGSFMTEEMQSPGESIREKTEGLDPAQRQEYLDGLVGKEIGEGFRRDNDRFTVNEAEREDSDRRVAEVLQKAEAENGPLGPFLRPGQTESFWSTLGHTNPLETDGTAQEKIAEIIDRRDAFVTAILEARESGSDYDNITGYNSFYGEAIKSLGLAPKKPSTFFEGLKKLSPEEEADVAKEQKRLADEFVDKVVAAKAEKQ